MNPVEAAFFVGALIISLWIGFGLAIGLSWVRRRSIKPYLILLTLHILTSLWLRFQSQANDSIDVDSAAPSDGAQFLIWMITQIALGGLLISAYAVAEYRAWTQLRTTANGKNAD